MALYKFRVRFEDDDYEDVIRDIEIKSTSTFEEFHYAILDAIGFDHQHLASFYLSNDNWKKGYEITLMEMDEGGSDPKAMMQDIRINTIIEDPHQKFVYVYDFIEMWTLLIELIGFSEEKSGVDYPQLVRTEGAAPKQYKQDNNFKTVGEDEFDNIAKSLLGGKLAIDDSDDDDDEDDDEHSIDDEISNDFDELSGGLDEDEASNF